MTVDTKASAATSHPGAPAPVESRKAPTWGAVTFDSDLTLDLDTSHGLIIGGTRRSGGAGVFAVHDPATGGVVALQADGTADDAVAAVDAASRALPGWRSTPARERSVILSRAFELMAARTEDLAVVIARENGKSLLDARGEVSYAAEFFRWYAEEAVRSDGQYAEAPRGGARTLVTHHPVGVAALVTPWNFPAAMATRKLGPALAAGCTTVLKPAAETPVTAVAISDILAEAGLPAGVVNLVSTSTSAQVVGAWMDDERVRKISFTGSTQVGRLLLQQASKRVVNTSMELGGNAPFIVTADADIEAAADGAMVAKFRNGGQACTAANKFYVHAAVAEAFVDAFAARMSSLRVGSAQSGADIGPMINARAAATIEAAVDAEVAAGAQVYFRSDKPDGACFVAPVLLTGVAATSRLVCEETFGPVAPVVTWTDEAEMLGTVNSSEYGLAAYVFAGSLQHAIRIAEQVEAGMVGINRGLVSDPAAPFGGVKQSGLGREGAREGLREFQEAQYLSIDWPA